MSQTIGDLIDRLAIVHVKLWHVNERLEETLEIRTREAMQEQPLMIRNQFELNAERAELVREIDERLDEKAKARTKL